MPSPEKLRIRSSNGITSPPSAEMCCPACKAALTLKQVIVILNGSGYQRVAAVKLPDGELAFLPAGAINPNEIEILD